MERFPENFYKFLNIVLILLKIYEKFSYLLKFFSVSENFLEIFINFINNSKHHFFFFYSMPVRACTVNISILCHHFVTY